MILPVCLGILLVGILIIPTAFAGCGPGTVLVDGVCELAPATSLTDEQEKAASSCGPGTVWVDGVCELKEASKSTSMSIEPLYVIIAVVAIGGIIGAIFAVRKGSKTTKPIEQESVTKKRIKTPPEFCQSCGSLLKPGARFCGKCGTPHS